MTGDEGRHKGEYGQARCRLVLCLGVRQKHGINMMQCGGKVIIKVVKEVLRTYLEVFISSFGHKQQVTVEKGHTDVGERKCRKVLWK